MAADERRSTPMKTRILSAFISVYRRLIVISPQLLTVTALIGAARFETEPRPDALWVGSGYFAGQRHFHHSPETPRAP
jgi:hypothetical protein